MFLLAGSAAAAESRGKIRSVTPDKNELIMNDSEGKAWTIQAAKDCKITLNDKEFKFADLQRDDEVQINYEKDGNRLVASVIRASRK